MDERAADIKSVIFDVGVDAAITGDEEVRREPQGGEPFGYGFPILSGVLAAGERRSAHWGARTR